MVQIHDLNPLPKQADVIVIGGGIIGCSTAYFLAKRGLDVLVMEKNHDVAWEQSGRNWGFVRQLGRDPKELPLMMRANRIWKGFEKELSADLGWQQGGILGLADDEAAIPAYEEWRDAARQHKLKAKILSGREIAKLMPGMARDWTAGIYVPSDGNADPELATHAIAAATRRLGGRIETNCAVLGISSAGGSVSSVRTERGTVKTNIVIVAAGAWTSRALDWLGLEMPQIRIRGTVGRTLAAERISTIAAWTPTLGFVQRRDGCFTVSGLDITDYDIRISDLRHARYFLQEFRNNRDLIKLQFGHPFWRDLFGHIPGSPAMADPLRRARVEAPMPNSARVKKIMQELHTLFPQLGQTELKKAWAGHIEITPDMLPVLDGEAGPSGLIIASGLSGHGFGIGPGVGATLAELAAGKTSSIDLSAFRLGRFADGSYGSSYNLV